MAERTFIGPLTRRQQYLRDHAQANTDLLAADLPEDCRGCRYVAAEIFGTYATAIAAGETDIPTATSELQTLVKGCAGPLYREDVYDAPPICPTEETEKWRQTPRCW